MDLKEILEKVEMKAAEKAANRLPEEAKEEVVDCRSSRKEEITFDDFAKNAVPGW